MGDFHGQTVGFREGNIFQAPMGSHPAMAAGRGDSLPMAGRGRSSQGFTLSL